MAPSETSVPLVLLAFALLGLTTGCGAVTAVDRGNLAHPTMTADDIAFGAASLLGVPCS